MTTGNFREVFRELPKFLNRLPMLHWRRHWSFIFFLYFLWLWWTIWIM